MQDEQNSSILSPDAPAMESFTSAAAAVDRLEALYTQATSFLSEQFLMTVSKGHPGRRQTRRGVDSNSWRWTFPWSRCHRTRPPATHPSQTPG